MSKGERSSTHREWRNKLGRGQGETVESEEDDIEAYLTTFNRMMAAYKVPVNRWPFKLARMLTGKAQQAYAAMEAAKAAADYAVVKTAILCRYDISEENYCQCVQTTTRK